MTQNEVNVALNLAKEHAKGLMKVLQKLDAHYYDAWEIIDAKDVQYKAKETELWKMWNSVESLMFDFESIRKVFKGNEKEIINKLKSYQ